MTTSLCRHLANLHKFLYSFENTMKSYLSIPNFKSISFKMALLQGDGQNLPPSSLCVIQKTPYGIGLINVPFISVNGLCEKYNENLFKLTGRQ